jgi:hypothetical protein
LGNSRMVSSMARESSLIGMMSFQSLMPLRKGTFLWGSSLAAT